MRYYELTYLILPELSQEEVKNAAQKTANFILEENGKVEKTVEPLKKTLAYLIKNKREAFLATIYFYLDQDRLENLEKKLKSESQILRYILLTKKVPKKVAQTMPKTPAISKLPVQITEKTKEPKKVALKELDKEIEEILKE